MRRFWLTGVCKPNKQDRQFSEPLATEQFLSAFLLLLSGIGLAFLLLAVEHLYFRYIRGHLARAGTTGGCCSLISLVTLDFIDSYPAQQHPSVVVQSFTEHGPFINLPRRRFRDAESIEISSLPRCPLQASFAAAQPAAQLRPVSGSPAGKAPKR